MRRAYITKQQAWLVLIYAKFLQFLSLTPRWCMYVWWKGGAREIQLFLRAVSDLWAIPSSVWRETRLQGVSPDPWGPLE